MNLSEEVVLGIRLSTLLLCVVTIVATAAVHVSIRRWVRRHPAGGDVPVTARARWWISRGIRTVRAPLELIIWLQAVRIIVRLLLTDATSLATASRGLTIVEWTYGVVMLVLVCWLLVRVGRLVEAVFDTVAARSANKWDDVILPLAGRAVRHLLPLVALILAAPVLAISPVLETVFRNGTSLVLIGVIAFVLIQVVDAVAQLLLSHHRIDTANNLHARGVYTQVMVLRRVAVAVIAVFALASMLMVFEPVRQFGASILASAGVAGIIVGLAAQRSIGMLLAGFQLALTQPIRVDDVVIVESEWGRIEEITLTYVVVRIWDLRRLVVPMTYFIEQPFQNWTRTSADLLAPVFLHVDYTVPVEAVRSELTRILEASPNWDRKVNVLQVTDAKERTIEVRALASAADASIAFALRCEVREKLIDFLQRQHPDSLPRIRGEVEVATGAA